MSRRYDRVSIRVDYTEDFSVPHPGHAAGVPNVSWQFLPIDTREERLAILWRWWAEDHQQGPDISNWV